MRTFHLLIGPWFGTGPDRAMALIFIVAGVIGLIVTLLALRSRSYRELSETYGAPPTDDDPNRQPQAAAA
jgi:DHA3 family multidrug efflux protein-like MFS transporter